MIGIVSFGVWRRRLSGPVRGGVAVPSRLETPRSGAYPAPAPRAFGSGCASGLTTTMGGVLETRSEDCAYLRSGIAGGCPEPAPYAAPTPICKPVLPPLRPLLMLDAALLVECKLEEDPPPNEIPNDELAVFESIGS